MDLTLGLHFLVLLGLMFLFMFLRFPVFLSLGLASVGYALIFPGTVPIPVFGQTLVQGLNSQSFSAIVFYFLLGAIMNSGGISDRLVDFFTACIGHVKGSLSHINILTSVLFAGISGSAVADTASVGSMCIPMMKKQGYPAAYAAAVTEMSSIIGPIIPPSTTFVLMASYLNVSVRKLFIAGLVPGLLMGAFELTASYVISKKRGFPSTPWGGWKNIWKQFKRNFWAIFLPVLIVVCLLAGVGTVTEIGALACLLALLISIFAYHEMTPRIFVRALLNTATQVGTIMGILATSGTFVWIVDSMGASKWMASQIQALNAAPVVTLTVCALLLFVLGMVLDTVVIQLVFIPIMVAPIAASGIDLVQFAVVAAIVISLGLNTPPVGGLLYMTASIAECEAVEVVKESMPFILAIVVLVVLLVAFPAISTALPALLTG